MAPGGLELALHPSLPPISDVPPHWLSYPKLLTSLGVSMLGPGPHDLPPGPGASLCPLSPSFLQFSNWILIFKYIKGCQPPLQNISVSPAALKIKMEILM